MRTGVTKAQLVESLSQTLQLTREQIDHLELKDEDTVVIVYHCGHRQLVNIAADSGMAIIRDVARAVNR